MTETTGFTDMAAHRLTEDLHEEILVHLPAESVLRFRAVCKAWRRIATDPRFLAAHARRRPAEAVVYTYPGVSPRENCPVGSATNDIALDVTPVFVESGRRRRLIRYPKVCIMLCSCGGVLLFKKGLGSYFLCNPATRQWADLPRLDDELHYTEVTDHNVEYAFYFHQPPGEYRLVCGHRTRTDRRTWCVLSTGNAEPRHADIHVEDGLVVPCLTWTASLPAPLHDRLHWAPCRDMSSHGETTKMVTFDMMTETFQSMMGPPTASTLTKLFVMDGLIVVADFGEGRRHIDLWFLENYGAKRWERRHQVVTPWGSKWRMPHRPSCLLSVAALADDQGNVMLGNHDGLVVYDVRRKTANYVATPPRNNVLMSRYVFRESLVQLPCLNVFSPMPTCH